MTMGDIFKNVGYTEEERKTSISWGGGGDNNFGKCVSAE